MKFSARRRGALALLALAGCGVAQQGCSPCDGSDERKRDERERLYGSGGESPEEPTRRRFWLGKLWPLPATTALLRPGWSAHEDIDMAYQGDVEIIHNWREEHSIEDLQRIVERKGYSAFSVGSFDLDL